MRGYAQTMMSTCGVNLFRYFQNYEGPNLSTSSLGGAGLGCAGFVDTPECRRAYDQLKEKFNIVYQSTPRLNRNSGRQFFFVVYDGRR